MNKIVLRLWSKFPFVEIIGNSIFFEIKGDYTTDQAKTMVNDANVTIYDITKLDSEKSYSFFKGNI